MFTCLILNSAYGWTAQNSVINSKNYVQRISFELLHRVYKTPKFLGYILYEYPSIKYVPSKFWSFIHPLLPVCLDTPLMTPFPTMCVRFLLSLRTKNTLWKLFCLVSYLRKSDFPLFWQPRKGWQPSRAVHEAQYLGFNIFLSTCWEHLFYHGSSSKSYSCRHFSKYLLNNSRTLSNHHKNYAKTFFPR